MRRESCHLGGHHDVHDCAENHNWLIASPGKRLPCCDPSAHLDKVHAWLRNSLTGQGRDSTRNLNRSIKAKKLQEKLLPSVQDLCSLLQAWAQSSGRPFILDNQDFLVRCSCSHATSACSSDLHLCVEGQSS